MKIRNYEIKRKCKDPIFLVWNLWRAKSMIDKDTIYRQDAIDALNACCVKYDISPNYDDKRTDKEKFYDWWDMHKVLSMRTINDLPSAEPRKKGKWIYGEKSGQDGWYCSECGGFIPWDYDFYGLDNIDFIEDFKTCPFCDSKMVSYTGADMRDSFTIPTEIIESVIGYDD